MDFLVNFCILYVLCSVVLPALFFSGEDRHSSIWAARVMYGHAWHIKRQRRITAALDKDEWPTNKYDAETIYFKTREDALGALRSNTAALRKYTPFWWLAAVFWLGISIVQLLIYLSVQAYNSILDSTGRSKRVKQYLDEQPTPQDKVN